MHAYKKSFREKAVTPNDCIYLWRGVIFLFLFDRLKEHWLIGLSDATFNEQRGRTIGGKLAWSSFCRTELMKPLWIKLKCGVYLRSCVERIHCTGNNYSNICPNQGCKGSIVSLCNAVKLLLMILSGNNLNFSRIITSWTLDLDILKKGTLKDFSFFVW